MIHNIPWTAPTQPAPAGLLASDGWWYPLAYAFVLMLTLVLMPGQLRESIRPLWAPVGRFLRRLYVPWLWAGLYCLSCVGLAYTPILCVLWGDYDRWSGCPWHREQLRRLGFPGFVPPIVT